VDAPLDVLAQHALQFGDKTAVVVDASGGARPSMTTFGELNALVNRLAHGLIAAGASSGERLVWCGPNSLEVLVTIHAARKLNLVAVPLSYRFNAEEMAYVIDNSDATTVIVDAEQAPLVAEVRRADPQGPHGDRVRRRCAAGLPALGFRVRRATRERTGGRAGKRSRLGDDLYVGHDRQAERRAAYSHRPPDRIRVARRAEPPPRACGAPHHGPLYHSGPLAFASLSHTLGAPIIVLRKFDAARWIDLVKMHRVTNSFSGAYAAQAHRLAAGRAARAGRHVVDDLLDRECGARSVCAQTGDH